MKKSFKIICSLLMIFLLIGCNNKKNKDNPIEENPKKEEKEEKEEQKEIIPIYKKVSTFMIGNTQVNENVLNLVPHYDFIYYIIDDNDDFVEIKYNGVKLIELFSYLGYKDYTTLEIIGEDNKAYIVDASLIDNKSYIAILENDEPISCNTRLILPDHTEDLYIKNLKVISFTK